MSIVGEGDFSSSEGPIGPPVHYVRFCMKGSVLRIVVSVGTVVTVGIGGNGHTMSAAAPREASHFIYASAGDLAGVKAAFLQFKIRNKEMLRTDRITWDSVSSPNGVRRVDIAYDAVDHREWAIASFSLVHPASLKAEISFQDGGSFGVFNKIGIGKWFMIWSPALPICPTEFPSVVAHLWGPKMFAACN